MNDSIAGKTIVITGANSGIGKAAATQLARMGATVVLACRSAERGAQAQEEICRTTGNTKVDLMLLDLSRQDSIRRFAAKFRQHHVRLDVLIHNAANFDLTLKKPVLTVDGVESIFATNHLGVFLLTQLLLDMLKASAPSRIITVASKGLTLHPFINVEFDNLNGERRFTPQHAYYQSKQGQVMFTYDLAEQLQGTGVTVNCVRVTNVGLPDERFAHFPVWMQRLYRIKRNLSITPEHMAETYVYLATDPGVEKITGGYWDEHHRQVRSNANSYNRANWQRLWDASERLIHNPVFHVQSSCKSNSWRNP